jgi:hypothetical protein
MYSQCDEIDCAECTVNVMSWTLQSVLSAMMLTVQSVLSV